MTQKDDVFTYSRLNRCLRSTWSLEIHSIETQIGSHDELKPKVRSHTFVRLGAILARPRLAALVECQPRPSLVIIKSYFLFS